MYESPVETYVKEISHKVVEGFDEYTVKSIIECGIRINRDELTRALFYDREQYQKGYADAKAEERWIPLKDGYPEDGTYCLVTIECSYGKSVIMAGFSENFRKWDFSGEVERKAFYRSDPVWGCIEVGGVVAWKPLPKPYERREKEK